MLLVDHAHFEAGGAAEDVLGLAGILHPRQLHHHAIRARLLHDRLGHAELVDAVAQRGDVLLQRELLDALLRFRPQRRSEDDLAGGALVFQDEVGQIAFDQATRLGAQRLVAELDLDALPLA